MFFNIFYWLKATSLFDILPYGVNIEKKIIVAPRTPERTQAVLGTIVLFP